MKKPITAQVLKSDRNKGLLDALGQVGKVNARGKPEEELRRAEFLRAGFQPRIDCFESDWDANRNLKHRDMAANVLKRMVSNVELPPEDKLTRCHACGDR